MSKYTIYSSNRLAHYMPNFQGAEHGIALTCEYDPNRPDPISAPKRDQRPVAPSPGWLDTFREASAQLANRYRETWEACRLQHLTELTQRLLLLEEQVAELATVQDRVTALEKSASRSTSTVVPISTLDPEPFKVIRDFQVVVQPEGEGFIATFFDGNIAASGDNQEEAVSNLKMLIVDTFESLQAEPTDNLGKEAMTQLEVLSQIIQTKG